MRAHAPSIARGPSTSETRAHELVPWKPSAKRCSRASSRFTREAEAVVGDHRRDRREQAQAVANSASAMPGATTARLVLCCPAMSEKLRMIPQTVPNRPTNGATEPIVARMLRRAGDLVGLRRHRRMQRDRQPRARALAIDPAARGRAAPFGDAGGEHLGGGMLLPPAHLVEGVDILGPPEVALEALAVAGGAAQLQPLADDDRPGPDAGETAARPSPPSRRCRPAGTGRSATSRRPKSPKPSRSPFLPQPLEPSRPRRAAAASAGRRPGRRR